MTHLQDLFGNWLVKTATIVLLAMLVIVTINIVLDLPYKTPLLGLLTLSLVPVLFIVETVIFAIAILKS